MSGVDVGFATAVRFGRRLSLDADVQDVDEWTELWDVTEYDDPDNNTGLFEAILVGTADVTASVPRHLLGLLDDDVAIDIEAGSDDAAVSCWRPIRVTALLQYRLDTSEVVDVDVQSARYHGEGYLP